VVAAVNVLNAAFMVAGGLAVAMLQKAGLGTASLFLIIGDRAARQSTVDCRRRLSIPQMEDWMLRSSTRVRDVG